MKGSVDNMKTQIFVMTHKKFNPPKDTVYVPLQVGSALNPDLGYMKDDTGDSCLLYTSPSPRDA